MPMKYCFVFCLLLASSHVCSQEHIRLKPLLKAAKEAVKNSSNQESNEASLLAVMDSSEVNDGQRAQIYYLCGELQRTVNEQENLKLYLKQEYDTLKLFSTILKMHEYAISCDSVERVVGKKFHYRSKGRNTLLMHRTNLLNGGKYLLKNNHNAEAYPYFDMYLRVPYEPMMERDAYLREDTLLPRVAYWATIAAYRAEHHEDALKHIDLAMEGADRQLAASLCEYKTNCYKATGDTAAWLSAFAYGVRHYPEHDYFYLRLMDYYNRVGMYDTGIALSDSIIDALGSRDIYWYGKSQMYLGKAEYDSCIVCSNNAIALDSTFVDAYYNKGVALLNEAIVFGKTMDTDVRSTTGKRDRVRLRGLYQYAREPMEMVRALAPDEKEKWAQPLYTIYLNLNLGDEFAEIEKILNEE